MEKRLAYTDANRMSVFLKILCSSNLHVFANEDRAIVTTPLRSSQAPTFFLLSSSSFILVQEFAEADLSVTMVEG